MSEVEITKAEGQDPASNQFPTPTVTAPRVNMQAPATPVYHEIPEIIHNDSSWQDLAAQIGAIPGLQDYVKSHNGQCIPIECSVFTAMRITTTTGESLTFLAQ